MIHALVRTMIVLLIVCAGGVRAAPMVTVSSWLGPAYTSADAGLASQNAVQAAYQGLSTYGTANTPSYYAGAITSANAAELVMTNGFNAWKGFTSPTGVYASQNGNEAAFLGIVYGNGTQISPSEISFTATSDDPGNVLGFDYTFTGYGTDQFGTTVLGVIYDHSGNVLITSGLPTKKVDAIFIAGLYNGLLADCVGCSEANQQQAILDAVNALPQGVTDYSGTFLWSPGGGGGVSSSIAQIASQLSQLDAVEAAAHLQITNGTVAEPPSFAVLPVLLLAGLFFTRKHFGK